MSLDFAVVGAGISGLAAALRLRQLRPAASVSLLDASDHAGGVIRTVRQGGFLIEKGPDSFLAVKPAALELARELGLEADLVPTNPACRRSFILRAGKLLAVPAGTYLLAPSSLRALAFSPLFSWRSKIRMAMEPFVAARRDGADESLGSFVRRRLGVEALERLAQPMVAGIYSADPDRLSLAATFPQFLEYERVHGSVLVGLRRRPTAGADGASGPRYGMFATLGMGLASLVDALLEKLGPGVFQPRSALRSVRCGPDGWLLSMADGSERQAGRLCLALPSWRSAELLSDAAPELAARLSAAPYGPSLTLHAAYERGAIAHPLDGMGFVVPTVEGKTLSACSFTSSKFAGRAPDGKVLLRAFTGGARAEPLLDQGDGEIARRLLAELAPVLGIRGEPIFWDLARHPRALPQYPVGHLETLEKIEAELARLPGLALAGNGYRGSGLPDCIASGQAAAEKLSRPT